MYFGGWDPTYLMLVPALIISLWAQYKVSSTFDRYSTVRSKKGYTGAQAARIILDSAGLYNISIELIRGKLSDHYDPTQRVLRLSEDVYKSNSVAALGVAAHEVGHAIQHKEGYKALEFRNSIAPIVNISSNISWILFFIGIILGFRGLTTLGIILFSIVVIFQLVTLPVEFNASSRALILLENNGVLYGEEIKQTKNVLNAAALTYVAATIMAFAQLLRLIVISDRNSRD